MKLLYFEYNICFEKQVFVWSFFKCSFFLDGHKLKKKLLKLRFKQCILKTLEQETNFDVQSQCKNISAEHIKLYNLSPLSTLCEVVSYGQVEQARGRFVGFFTSNGFSHKTIMVISHHHSHHIYTTLHCTAVNRQKSLNTSKCRYWDYVISIIIKYCSLLILFIWKCIWVQLIYRYITLSVSLKLIISLKGKLT